MHHIFKINLNKCDIKVEVFLRRMQKICEITTLDLSYVVMNGQTYGGGFAKFCGLLRIYTLYCGTKMWKHDAKNVDKQKVLGCKSVFRASIQVDV